MEKIEIYCEDCDANFIIIHDLDKPYEISYCIFCGTQLEEENTDINKWIEL